MWSYERSAAALAGQARAYAREYGWSLTDAARHVVNVSRSHGDDFDTFSYEEAMDAMAHYFQGTADAPAMLCGHAAQILNLVYGQLGIQSRYISVSSVQPGTGGGHAVVEALNPATGKWEVQDPDYGVKYVDSAGRTASIRDILAAPDVTLFTPTDNIRTGWLSAGSGAWAPEDLRQGQFYDAFIDMSSNTMLMDWTADRASDVFTLLNNSDVRIAKQIGISSYGGWNNVAADADGNYMGADTNDLLRSRDADATVMGGFGGDDVLTVTKAISSQLYGHGGDDRITGGHGDDVIVGGPGSDVVAGSLGYDMFIFQNNDSWNDIIYDFDPNEDTLTFQFADEGAAFDSMISQSIRGDYLRVVHDQDLSDGDNGEGAVWIAFVDGAPRFLIAHEILFI